MGTPGDLATKLILQVKPVDVNVDAGGDPAGTMRRMQHGASGEGREAVRRARWAHC